MSKIIRALVVDDSPLYLSMLTSALEAEGDIKVVATATDPAQARDAINAHAPDIITLDIEMPKMSGLAFLQRIIAHRPTPVIMVSTLTHRGGHETLQALELGAVDFLPKPSRDIALHFESFAFELRTKARAAARTNVQTHRLYEKDKSMALKKPTYAPRSLIAIGASTGGVEAIRGFLSRMPPAAPPIVIGQHMPVGFTARFAERLNAVLPFTITEATHDMPINSGRAYLSPSDSHLTVIETATGYRSKLIPHQSTDLNRPSIDYLMHSVAEAARENAYGFLLTGMGSDGANGLKAIKDAGGYTAGQSQASALIYGMPRAAKAINAVIDELPLEQLPVQLLKELRQRSFSPVG